MENRRRFIIYCCIVGVLLASIVGICIGEYSGAPVALNKPIAVYQEAINRINGQENIYLNITFDKTTTIGTQIFREQSQQTLSYENLGTEEMVGFMDETLLIGNYSISITEIYSNQTGYFIVNNNGFTGTMTQDEYMARFIPVAMVTPELYAKVNGIITKTEKVIYFTYGAAPESWAVNSGIKDIVAEATVHLDLEGNLSKTNYQLSYSSEDINTTITATVEILKSEPIKLPDNMESYTPITYLDGPKDLEVACGQLLMANCSTAAYSDTISCEAFGDIRKKSIGVHACNNNFLTAQVDTKVTLENSGKAGVISTTQKTEAFEKNTYIARVDDGAPATGNIHAEEMQSYCNDILVSTIMLPEYITEAKLTETDNAYHVEFTGNESFAQMLSAEACNTLYQNSDILTALAQDYETTNIRCYLTIDKTTGLPIASGFTYSGTYSISKLPYSLLYQADQNYDLLTSE